MFSPGCVTRLVGKCACSRYYSISESVRFMANALVKDFILMTEVYSEPCQTSKMMRLAEIINGFYTPLNGQI